MESLTYVAPLPPPSGCTGACVGSHTLAFVHARWLTHTWKTHGHMLNRKPDILSCQLGCDLLF